MYANVNHYFAMLERISWKVPDKLGSRVASEVKGSCQKNFRFFLGDLSQMWVGRVADSQTRPNPLKITAKIAFFDPNFNLRFPKSRKNPWVGKHIWERFFFLDAFPYTTECEPFPII